jgi:hypothetical protein
MKMHSARSGFLLIASLLSLATTRLASAEEPAPEATAKPAPYSLPWQLRPAAPVTALRSDTSLAFYDQGGKGSTTVSTLLFSYKVLPNLAPLVRLGIVQNSPANSSLDGTSFMNPVVGATYGLKLPPPFKLAFFLGLTIPVGGGSGDHPNAATALAMKSGILARSAMDNAMFAQNYFTVFPGVDFAVVSHGFTAQAEGTIFRLTRVRGTEATQDGGNTNLTMGLHVGYFIIDQLSLGAELRHQRWLSTPRGVKNDKIGEATRDTTTFAVGPRVNLKLTETIAFRPGVSFALGLDKPMTTASYKIVQLDLPFTF